MEGNEVWLEITEHPSYYISNTGKIKRNDWILSPAIGTSGYLHVILYNKGIPSTRDIHRLVALCFCDNPENKPEVNHKDSNKLNNNDWNLEWSTEKYNILHAIETGLRSDFGENSSNSILTELQVLEIRSSNLTRKELAAKYGIHRDYISLIINRKRWKHI